MNTFLIGLWAFGLFVGQNPAPTEPVRAVIYSPQGDLVYAGQGSSLVMVNTSDGSLLKKMPSGFSQVTALALSKDGKKLAMAEGNPGQKGSIRVFHIGANRLPVGGELVFEAHKDLIHDLAFHPNGDMLASCSYDKLVKIWSVQDKKLLQELKDHSDAVNSLGFNHDGTLFASTGSDRAVKVWEVASWKKLHTLSDPTDWMYTLHWHPSRNLLAGGGVDQTIRVWDISKDSAKLQNSVFAHSAPVRQLRWNPTGSHMVSVGEDKSWKVWDTKKYSEALTKLGLADTPFCVAFHPAKQEVAIGKMDSKLDSLDATNGKMLQVLLPAKKPKPVAGSITPNFMTLGTRKVLTLEAKNLQLPLSAKTSDPGVNPGKLEQSKSGAFVLEVHATPIAKVGDCKIILNSASGEQLEWNLEIDRYSRVFESNENDSRVTGQKIHLPATLKGNLSRAGDCDWYVFERKKGDEIAVQLNHDAEAKNFSPVLSLHSPDGRLLVESSQGLLAHKCEQEGTYSLEVRDREFRGGTSTGSYRLHLGDFPLVTSIFPRGWKAGEKTTWKLEGVGLGGKNTLEASIPATAKLGEKVSLDQLLGKPLTGGDMSSVVASFTPEVVFKKSDPATLLPFPGVGNAEFTTAREVHVWEISAKKGQRVLVETMASRIGASVDTFVEILDSKGQPLPWKLLRGTARTFTIFRDHDSFNPGIRIEAWNELAVDDYVLIGTDLMRIRALPRNPDDDCRFYQLDGRRLGYLGTTPTHHYLGQPIIKVEFHAPGTNLPPNGLPQVVLFHQNDDGGPRFAKDSHLVFDPPEDGKYLIRVREMQDRHGAGVSYRLEVRPPELDFEIRVNNNAIRVPAGSGIPVNVDLVRKDEFMDSVEVTMEDLPKGFHAPKLVFPSGEVSATFSLFAEANAPKVDAGAKDVTIRARGVIHGKTVERVTKLKAPLLADPGDIQTFTGVEKLVAKAGTNTKLQVKIERRNKFEARVPLDVQGLPHGARVLNVGLNGILITPRETERTIDIQVDSWLAPGEYPFVVLARQEGKNLQYAAKSVVLQVVR